MDFRKWTKDVAFLSTLATLLSGPLARFLYLNAVSGWGWIIYLLYFIFAAVFSYIYFLTAKYSDKTTLWSIKNSLAFVFTHFFDYTKFCLSFITWWIIPFLLYIILFSLLKISYYSYGYFAYNSLLQPFMFGLFIYYLPYRNMAKSIYFNQLTQMKKR